MKIDPSLHARWPEPISIEALRQRKQREAEFDQRIAEILVELLAVAWKYDYSAFLNVLRKMGVRPHQRRALTEQIEQLARSRRRGFR